MKSSKSQFDQLLQSKKGICVNGVKDTVLFHTTFCAQIPDFDAIQLNSVALKGFENKLLCFGSISPT
jgi:hypothetical protein